MSKRDSHDASSLLSILSPQDSWARACTLLPQKCHLELGNNLHHDSSILWIYDSPPAKSSRADPRSSILTHLGGFCTYPRIVPVLMLDVGSYSLPSLRVGLVSTKMCVNRSKTFISFSDSPGVEKQWCPAPRHEVLGNNSCQREKLTRVICFPLCSPRGLPNNTGPYV